MGKTKRQWIRTDWSDPDALRAQDIPYDGTDSIQSKVDGLSGDFVDLTNNQSVSGTKTFTDQIAIEDVFIHQNPSKPNTATGIYSHAQGDTTTAGGNYAHAEGHQCTALGDYSHAEGQYTDTNGPACHAEGGFTLATTGAYCHAEGYFTVAKKSYQHAAGMFNEEDDSPGTSTSASLLSIIGNGSGTTDRSNAFKVRRTGEITWGGRPNSHSWGQHGGITHFGALSSDPTAVSAGDRYFNYLTMKERLWDGSEWKSLIFQEESGLIRYAEINNVGQPGGSPTGSLSVSGDFSSATKTNIGNGSQVDCVFSTNLSNTNYNVMYELISLDGDDSDHQANVCETIGSTKATSGFSFLVGRDGTNTGINIQVNCRVVGHPGV